MELEYICGEHVSRLYVLSDLTHLDKYKLDDFDSRLYVMSDLFHLVKRNSIAFIANLCLLLSTHSVSCLSHVILSLTYLLLLWRIH